MVKTLNRKTMTLESSFRIGGKIGRHVLVGHYSNLKSAFADSKNVRQARYVGKATVEGKVWHFFNANGIKFACRDYTRKCDAFSVVEIAAAKALNG